MSLRSRKQGDKFFNFAYTFGTVYLDYEVIRRVLACSNDFIPIINSEKMNNLYEASVINGIDSKEHFIFVQEYMREKLYDQTMFRSDLYYYSIDRGEVYIEFYKKVSKKATNSSSVIFTHKNNKYSVVIEPKIQQKTSRFKKR